MGAVHLWAPSLQAARTFPLCAHLDERERERDVSIVVQCVVVVVIGPKQP